MPDPQLTPEQIARATVEYQKQRDVLESLNDQFDDIEKSLTIIAAESVKFAKTNKDSIRQVGEIKSIYNSLSKTARTLSNQTEEFSNGLLKTKEISKTIRDITRDEDRIQRQINQAYNAGNAGLIHRLQKQLKILDAEKKAALELKKENELIDEQVGLTGKLLSGLEKIPILGDAIDFEEINTSMRQAAGNSNVFAAGLKTAGKQLKEGLKDPLVQFALLTAFYGKIIKAAYKHNELITNLGKQLGISKDNAQKLYDTSFKYATTSHDSFVTATRLAETQQKLNSTLGTSVNLGNENAEVAARLTHFYGLSEESAGKIVELGVEQGKNGLDILNATAKTYTLQKAQYGGSLSFNKVLDKVANVSSDIYIKFKGNTQAIAQAVMQADRLGLSLEQVDKIGESLLNFESSIENELKAELLTGKQINLEKARQYALSGDTAKLTQEMAKQVGGIHQFEKMNVIQRKAYAEAMGMSVQEMSTMLRKQEFESKLTKEAKESAKATLEYADKNGIQIDAALRAQYEQKSLADEQKETFEKLNEILGKIVEGPMRQFLGLIETILHKVNSVFEIIGSFTGGPLGNALGALLLGAPLLIGAVRMLGGGIKAMLLGARGSTPANPQFVYDTASGGGGGGVSAGISDLVSSRSFGGKRNLVKKFGGAKGARAAIGGRMGMLKGLGGGAITAAIGMGADLIAGQMDEGGAQDAVSGLGTTASWAGTGAMIGSIIPGVGTVVGGVLGGVAGGIKALFDAESNARERERAEKEKKEEQQKATNDLLQQFLDRPIHLNMNNETILKFNTNSNLYGTQQSVFN